MDKSIRFDFVKSTHNTGVDPLDLDNRNFKLLENLEVDTEFGKLSSRKGLDIYCESPDELYTPNTNTNVFGHTFSTYTKPNVDNLSAAEQYKLHMALVKDTSLPDGTTSEYHRGRFVVGLAGEDHSWSELTTHAALTASGQTAVYGTKLGNTNTIGGFAVQGFPIDGHINGYQAYTPITTWSQGTDAFGHHTQIGLGGMNNRSMPLMLQFINKPKIQNEASRGLGYFNDQQEYSGWYFSKAAPTTAELMHNFSFDVDSVNSLTTSTEPTVCPGSYTYYVAFILDGVNPTEAVEIGSVKIDDESTSRKAPYITVETRANTSTNADIDTPEGSNLSVGAWDCFPKRVTDLLIFREFTKGKWSSDEDDEGVNLQWKTFQSHSPRLLGRIPINNMQNLYGDYDNTDLFEPNRAMWAPYTGVAEVVSVNAGADTSVVKLSDTITADLQWQEGVFGKGTIYFDYDYEGNPVSSTYNDAKITSPGLKSDQTIVINNALPATWVDEEVKVRIGAKWELGSIDDNYILDIIDHRYEWAAGTDWFQEAGDVVRPNWGGRTLISEQAFVWDLWEHNIADLATPRTYRRRIRFAVPNPDGTFPTTMYRGRIDIEGDEYNNPITAIIPIKVDLGIDTTRLTSLVCGRQTSSIMTVTDNIPVVQPQEYQYGVIGPNAWIKDGETVYGLSAEGVLWRFTLTNGFEPIGQNIQQDLSFSETDLTRTAMSIFTYDNGQRGLWIEFVNYNDEYLNPSPGYDVDDTFGKVSCIGVGLPIDYVADRGDGYCYKFVDDPLWYVFPTLTDSGAVNFGYRYNLSTGTFTKRTGVSASVTWNNESVETEVENYFLAQVADDDKESVWFGNSQLDSGFTRENQPIFLKSSATKYYDTVPDIIDPPSTERTFGVSVRTKEIAPEPYGVLAYFKEVLLFAGGPATTVTIKFRDLIRSLTTTITTTLAKYVRKYTNSPMREGDIEITAETTRSQLTPIELKALELRYKTFSKNI